MIHQKRGTRFRLFPQAPFLPGFGEPDIVWIDTPVTAINPGPEDNRLYVVDPVAKQTPYDEFYRPPYRGECYPPVQPGTDGHFDHLEVGSREFNAAHMYAVVRCVLDIWENYFGRPIRWHFSRHYERLELIPSLHWDNAHSGYGFIEAGYTRTEAGEPVPHCLNFDVLAHEFGHSIIYAEVGSPELSTRTAEYFGFHESAADLTALISVLHFESVVDRLLQCSRGNLYTLNELNRIGELSEIEQIRLACNDYKMSDFAHGWPTEHWLSLPLTGAIFDILVDLYQIRLREQGLIDSPLAELSFRVPDAALDYDAIQQRYALAYDGHHAGFKAALIDARDYLGRCLAVVWHWLSPHYLSYSQVGELLLAADRALSGGRYQPFILENFLWREVGQVAPGPGLSTAPAEQNIRSCRA